MDADLQLALARITSELFDIMDLPSEIADQIPGIDHDSDWESDVDDDDEDHEPEVEGGDNDDEGITGNGAWDSGRRWVSD